MRENRSLSSDSATMPCRRELKAGVKVTSEFEMDNFRSVGLAAKDH